jgi:hypothetical protein
MRVLAVPRFAGTIIGLMILLVASPRAEGQGQLFPAEPTLG